MQDFELEGNVREAGEGSNYDITPRQRAFFMHFHALLAQAPPLEHPTSRTAQAPPPEVVIR